MSEPVKIVITLEGGMIQDVLSCGVPVEFVVIDYDTDGAEQSELIDIPQGAETIAKASGYIGRADGNHAARALQLFETVEVQS